MKQICRKRICRKRSKYSQTFEFFCFREEKTETLRSENKDYRLLANETWDLVANPVVPEVDVIVELLCKEKPNVALLAGDLVNVSLSDCRTVETVQKSTLELYTFALVLLIH